jgi:uncharacterized protein YbaA (DUF1428 family)
MSYIEGFIVPVKTQRKQEYRDLARKAAGVYKEYGALRVVESWGDDVPPGKVTDFRTAVKAEADETIVFSWIEWPSKEVRDAGNKKLHDDPRMKMTENPPFSAQRMIYAGFAPLFDSTEARK